MSATIRDVAKLAGVSASTVSRVINKSAPISGETTERIYRAMEELKYVPNDIARSFASGSARAIAIAVNVSDTRSYANRFFNNTVFGIETAAHRKGYNFIITSANDERGGMGSLEKLILSKKIDGRSDEQIAETIPCDYTTVWRNRKRLVQKVAVMLYGAQAVL